MDYTPMLLFKQLADDVKSKKRSNTLNKHTVVAEIALRKGGADDGMIHDLIGYSLKSLKDQRVDAPTHIPWY